MDQSVRLVLPGSRICVAADHFRTGNGTYKSHGYIYSSLAGVLKIGKSSLQAGSDDKKAFFTIEVHPPREVTVLPAVGDIVTCIVSSVNPRFAKVLIKCVREITLHDPFRALIRREDVRMFEKDKVEIYRCFRPGDIVLARVISLGEASSGYLLTTAENELGVVIARSEVSGVNMVPVSWSEMQCPKTYNKEFRKVAKVIPENLAAAMTAT